MNGECEDGACEPRYVSIVHAQQRRSVENRLDWLRENDPGRYYDAEWRECEDWLIDAAVDPASTLRQRPMETDDIVVEVTTTMCPPPVVTDCYVTRLVWDEDAAEWREVRSKVV